jgi:hypothetical protein
MKKTISTNLVTQYSWKEVGSEEAFYHPMVFWMKTLPELKEP